MPAWAHAHHPPRAAAPPDCRPTTGTCPPPATSWKLRRLPSRSSRCRAAASPPCWCLAAPARLAARSAASPAACRPWQGWRKVGVGVRLSSMQAAAGLAPGVLAGVQQHAGCVCTLPLLVRCLNVEDRSAVKDPTSMGNVHIHTCRLWQDCRRVGGQSSGGGGYEERKRFGRGLHMRTAATCILISTCAAQPHRHARTLPASAGPAGAASTAAASPASAAAAAAAPPIPPAALAAAGPAAFAAAMRRERQEARMVDNPLFESEKGRSPGSMRQ